MTCVIWIRPAFRDVNGHLALQLAGVKVPEGDPSARWMM
jgi:hypothetical protein